MKTGMLKLKTEAPEDLWHLEKILEPGDIVTARTSRRKTIKRGSELVRGERVPITLSIELGKAVMETGQLRLRGKITSSPKHVKDMELASYHSITIQPYMEVKIKKAKWTRQQLDRLRKAGVKEPLLFICVLDREEAYFASLGGSGIEMRGMVRSSKVLGMEDNRSEYYAEISKVLEKESKAHNAVIVAGPGFEKENLFNYLKEKLPGIVSHVSIETANSMGRTGVQEVIKTSANRVLKQTRIAKETGLVEQLLAEIGREGRSHPSSHIRQASQGGHSAYGGQGQPARQDSRGGLVTYGQEHVRKAALAGAVQTLLISEESVPDNEGLMDAVEKMQGDVIIITSNHEAGERFLYLGGIAAFLRYRLGG